MKKKVCMGLLICIGSGLIIVIGIFFAIKKTNFQQIAIKIADEMAYDNIKYSGSDENYKYSYIEKAIIKDPVDNEAITIEKYNSNKEAEMKKEYIEKMYKMYHEKYDNTLISLFKIDDCTSVFNGEKDNAFVVGKYLIRMNDYSYYPSSKKNIKNIIKNKDKNYDNKKENKEAIKYWNKQMKNSQSKVEKEYKGCIEEATTRAKNQISEYSNSIVGCKGKDCEEYFKEISKYEKYEEVKEDYIQAKAKYDEEINKKKSVINSINNKLSKVEKNLSKKDLEDVQNEIKKLDDNYYDESKLKWNDRISKIEKDVFKNSCRKYNYKDLLRNPSDYEGKNAYFFGEIIQKIDSSNYRVDVNCKKYSFSNDYYCDDTIYMTYSGDINLIEDDMIKVWGTMNGTQTYETVMGATVTIPKFAAKYVSIN